MIVSSILKRRILTPITSITLLCKHSALFRTPSTLQLKYALVFVPRNNYATKFFKRKTIDFEEENEMVTTTSTATATTTAATTRPLELEATSSEGNIIINENTQNNNENESVSSDQQSDDELVSLSSFDWEDMSEEITTLPASKKAWNFSKKKGTEKEPHTDLESFLAQNYDQQTTYYRGTLFEYQALNEFKKWGLFLERTGGALDQGIDLRGVWKFPEGEHVNVIVQCKKYATLLSPDILREFEGTLSRLSNTQKENVVGILATNQGFSKNTHNYFLQGQSTPPIALCVMTEQGITQCRVNKKFREILPRLVIASRHLKTREKDSKLPKVIEFMYKVKTQPQPSDDDDE